MKHKIIIVDDHDMFREGIKTLINTDKNAEVIAEARDGIEFLEILEKHTPDLVLMDISMPRMDGIEATIRALLIQPSLKILALTMFGDEEYYYKMIHAGVKGFVVKNSDIQELRNAINTVASGQNYFSDKLLARIVSNFRKLKEEAVAKSTQNDKLSAREIEIIKYICDGQSDNKIADSLDVTINTIKKYHHGILSKTGCTNTASLIMYSIKNKLIEI